MIEYGYLSLEDARSRIRILITIVREFQLWGLNPGKENGSANGTKEPRENHLDRCYEAFFDTSNCECGNEDGRGSEQENDGVRGGVTDLRTALTAVNSVAPLILQILGLKPRSTVRALVSHVR